MRVTVKTFLCLALLLMVGAPPVQGQWLSEEAARLHKQAFIFDAHVHFINRQLYLGGDIADRLPGPVSEIGVDLPSTQEGGLDAFFLNLYVEPNYTKQHFEVKQTLRLLDLAQRQIRKNNARIEIALNGRDIDRIRSAGKIAAVLDLEGAFDYDGDLGVLRGLYALGLRSVQFADNAQSNGYADASCCASKWNGINDRGRALLREMNRLGMVVNLAHASEATWMQVVELSDDPVVATHQGLRAFNPRHSGNASDEMVKVLAAKGGVLAVHFSPNTWSPRFFDYSRNKPPSPDPAPPLSARPSYDEIVKYYRLAYQKPGEVPPPDVVEPISRFVEVVDYAVKLIGEDHVALGSDFGGGLNSRASMTNIGEYGRVTEALVDKGYTEERIRKILGGNLLRVFRRVTGGGEH